jgi:hypothetical protein
MWWTNYLIPSMFILCFYSFKNVGALNAVRSNRSLKKIAIIERLLFEEGRKDYGSVMKTGKTTDRISQCKELTKNSKYQLRGRKNETIIQLQNRKGERMANERY